MKTRVSRRDRKALTLMEVMLVLVILGILGSMAAMFVSSARKDALRRTTKAEIDVFTGAIDRYSMHMYAPPQTQDGLRALIEQPSNDSNNRWAGPYIKPGNDLKDPWGNLYEYSLEQIGTEQVVVIKSGGPDGSIGSEDDITSEDQF